MTREAKPGQSQSRASAPRPEPHRLQPRALEIVSQFMFGEDSETEPLPGVDRLTPLAALEEVVLPALARPPCLVSFSGGRDSSTVLAAAARVARREGLPLPVPITLRFPHAPRTEETSWQELVMRYLRLDDWRCLEFEDELDYVGPVARAVVGRHGPLWPVNAYVHAPMLAEAQGGSLLTGAAGDVFFLGRPRRRSLTAWPAPTRRELLAAAYFRLPVPVRHGLARFRRLVRLPWLRPAARRAVAAGLAAGPAEPWSRDSRVEWHHRQRYQAAGRHSLALMAADSRAHAISPFLEPRFLAALARAYGRGGLGDRTAVMRRLFSGLLPAAVLERRTKARFAEVFSTARFREFRRNWQGGGVDAELVDEEALHKLWNDGNDWIVFRSILLAQSVTMANGESERDRGAAEAR